MRPPSINAKNQEKTASATSRGIIICYTDSKKHIYLNYDRKFNKTRPKYQEVEHSPLNARQQKMYLEALYGTSIYPEAAVNKMPKELIIKIETRATLVQKAINKWKQEIVNEGIDDLLSFVFPNSPVVKGMLDIPADDSIRCKFTFKELGLNQLKVAEKLVSLSLLPSNFFEI